MSDLVLFSKLSNLPQNLKIEVIDYIEFLEQKYKTSKPHPKAGCMKGTFKMSADFDAPLDDFKVYRISDLVAGLIIFSYIYI